MNIQRLPLPPFTEQTAKEKVKKAEDAWNTKNPFLISEAYTIDTEWRNRDLFIDGREEVKQFLTLKWKKEFSYKLNQN